MKIGVVGHTGVIGSELVGRGYTPIDFHVKGLEEFTIGDTDFDLIVYCAGYTDVDKAQECPSDALLVNAWGVHHILNVYRGQFLYLSTDHVFSGKKWITSGYTERHEPSPVNMYGITKFTGEQLVLATNRKDNVRGKVVRTSKVFDMEYLNSRLYGVKKTPKEFSSVLKRSYLHVKHLVNGLVFVLNNWEKMPTILNVSGTDILSEYMFMLAVAKAKAIPEENIILRYKKLKNVTPRPLRAGLNVNRAKKLGVPLYSAWDGVKLL